MNITVVYLFKAMIAVAGLFLCFIVRLTWKKKNVAGRRWACVGLVLVAGLSTFAYFDFGFYPLNHRFMNVWDFYHYYMGAKYSEEVGYFGLYESAVIANLEGTAVMKGKRHRSLENYRFQPNNALISRAAEIKAPFTEERWEEFKTDLRYFETKMPRRRWINSVHDKGYNATPVWNMVGWFLTDKVSTLSEGGMFFLLCIDLALIVVMLSMVNVAFGFRIALLAAIFFATNFLMNFTHIRGAFLRLDWVTLLVMSACMLRLNHYKTAGAMMAYAGAARIFPFIFVGGIAAKFFWDTLKHRKLDSRYVGFFVTFAVVVALLAGSSLAFDGGTEHWREFFAKIELHDSDLSGLRVGFKYLFIMAYKVERGQAGWELEKLAFLDDHKVLWYGIQAFVLLLVFFASRKLDAYEALCLGYVPAFFLTAPTFYYHVMLIVPFIYFAPKILEAPRLIGLCALFVMSISLYVLHTFLSLGMPLSFTTACMLLVLCLYMLFVAFREASDRDALEVSAESVGEAA